jgi:hypothetical protein
MTCRWNKKINYKSKILQRSNILEPEYQIKIAFTKKLITVSYNSFRSVLSSCLLFSIVMIKYKIIILAVVLNVRKIGLHIMGILRI